MWRFFHNLLYNFGFSGVKRRNFVRYEMHLSQLFFFSEKMEEMYRALQKTYTAVVEEEKRGKKDDNGKCVKKRVAVGRAVSEKE